MIHSCVVGDVLVTSVQRLLEEHAGDEPTLSYTGKPIVKWPRRVRMGLLSMFAVYVISDIQIADL